MIRLVVMIRSGTPRLQILCTAHFLTLLVILWKIYNVFYVRLEIHIRNIGDAFVRTIYEYFYVLYKNMAYHALNPKELFYQSDTWQPMTRCTSVTFVSMVISELSTVSVVLRRVVECVVRDNYPSCITSLI